MSGRRTIRAWIAIAGVIAILLSVLGGMGSTSSQAITLSGGDFMAGSIISDAMFYNPATMSSAQIQGFLTSEEPSCNTGYTCLKSYTQNTVSHAADSRCGAYNGVAGQLASDIIYNVSQACGVNPQVLIVLLQKEQNLVTSASPSSGAYNAATGYACPSTCNPTYAGFENQVYGAAHQFKVYQASPNSFNYRAGQNNTISLNPNPNCGTATVYIQNQATAGLYDYTPYVPNAAALANLNGPGDGCSSYGNRNFWVFFSEWFGNAQGGGSFAKSASNPTIYLLTAGNKYPVPNPDVLNSYWALGPYRTVSDAYLAEFATGSPLGPVIRDPTTGNIYYSDLGVKHYVTSCALLVDYANNCSNAIDLLPSQIQLLPTGANLDQFAHSAANGAVYYVNAGVKQWVHTANDVSNLNGGSIPPLINLSQTTLASIPDGADYVGVGTVIQSTGGGPLYMVDANDRLVPVRSATAAAEFGANIVSVSPGTIAAYTVDNSTILTAVVNCGSSYYIAGNGKLWTLTTNSAFGLGITTLDPTTCAALPHATQAVSNTLFLRAPTGAIYYVNNGTKAHVLTADGVYALNGASPLVLVPVAQATLDGIGFAPDILGPTQLVKSASQPSVYMVDGLHQIIPIDLFQTASEFGINGYSVVSDQALGAYASTGADLTLAVTCGSTYYFAGGGAIWRLAQNSSFGLPVTSLDPLTCGDLPVATGVVWGPLFVRSPTTGAIYEIANGQKIHMNSMSQIYALNGGNVAALVPLSDIELSKIPG